MDNTGNHHRLPSDPTIPVSSVETEGELASGEKFRPIVLAGITLLLVAVCVALSVPFLSALAWAVALAIIAWPVNAWLVKKTNRPALAAIISTAIVVLVIVVPALLVTWQLTADAGKAIRGTEAKPPEEIVRQTVDQTPGLATAAQWMDRVGVDITHEVRELVSGYFRGITGLLQGSLAALIQAAIALYVLFFLFRDRDVFARGVRSLLPMTRAEIDKVFESFSGSVHANLYAAVVTSAINGVAFGLLFAVLGIPSPTLWGVVVFVLSIIPVLGTFIVWLPASVYLAMTGRLGAAAALVAVGVLTAILVDTVLYVRLAGNRMRLHPVPTFLAFIGGLTLFGASGIILGPAALAVTAAVLQVWNRRVHEKQATDLVSEREPASASVG